MRLALTIALFVMAMMAGVAVSQASTLETIKNRGFLRCGTNGSTTGFSAINQKGEWAGIDADFCRALSAAVLGNKDAVEFIPLSGQARFPALQDSEIDVLSRNTTGTYSRDTGLGVDFVVVTFYDGQGFLARRSLGAKNLQELPPDTRICLHRYTTTETNLADYKRLHGLDFAVVRSESVREARAGLFSGRCDVYTTDRGALSSMLVSETPDPADYVIFPEVISKEPLGIYVRDDDAQWRKIVRWVVYATIEAEERGITSGNADSLRTSQDPTLRALLGRTPGFGGSLGLDDEWAYRVIRQVGNYGEIFERNLGAGTPIAMERGLNALWRNGGLMYAPPMR